jgi:hypothetical protein
MTDRAPAVLPDHHRRADMYLGEQLDNILVEHAYASGRGFRSYRPRLGGAVDADERVLSVAVQIKRTCFLADCWLPEVCERGYRARRPSYHRSGTTPARPSFVRRKPALSRSIPPFQPRSRNAWRLWRFPPDRGADCLCRRRPRRVACPFRFEHASAEENCRTLRGSPVARGMAHPQTPTAPAPAVVRADPDSRIGAKSPTGSGPAGVTAFFGFVGSLPLHLEADPSSPTVEFPTANAEVVMKS